MSHEVKGRKEGAGKGSMKGRKWRKGEDTKYSITFASRPLNVSDFSILLQYYEGYGFSNTQAARHSSTLMKDDQCCVSKVLVTGVYVNKQTVPILEPVHEYA